MSHVDSGFCIRDLVAMKATIGATCPDLEMEKSNEYRTWVTDNNRLVGDHPLPWVHQIRLVKILEERGISLQELADRAGVVLPTKIAELEDSPWDLETQRKLLQVPAARQAYDKIVKDVVSKDAEYVIRPRQGHPLRGKAYEIGLVPHPCRSGEYVMMTDFYNDGNGLLKLAGVGGYHRGDDGKDNWGGELKKHYAVNAAERQINAQIRAGNPEFGSYRKVAMPNGVVRFEVEPRR